LKRKEEDRFEEFQTNFEQQLAIHRPEAYKQYQEDKERTREDNGGYDEIIWSSPKNMEEARELGKLIEEANKNFTPPDYEENLRFNERLESLRKFKGIDLSELGDEDDA